MTKLLIVCSVLTLSVFTSCNDNKTTDSAQSTSAGNEQTGTTRQADVKDDMSQKNVVQVAISSPDHSTLVKAVQAADLVNALSNTGPFTVFAPTNAAFDKLPAGTVENLLKPENKEALADILQYHVSLGVYKTESLKDGQVLGQVNGDNITVSVKDGKIMIGGATVVASVPAANGIVHVIDGVMLPPKK